MVSIRHIFAALGVAAVVACNAAPPGGTQPPSGATPTATPAAATPIGATPTGGATPAITLPPSATATPPPTSAPVGDNKLTYEATGEYQASGELIFNAEASISMEDFGGGWVAYFDSADGQVTARLSTQPGEESIEIFLGEDVIRAGVGEPNSNCTWEIAPNDPTGTVGSGDCVQARLYPSENTRFNLTVDWTVIV